MYIYHNTISILRLNNYYKQKSLTTMHTVNSSLEINSITIILKWRNKQNSTTIMNKTVTVLGAYLCKIKCYAITL
jgi:hypothetical protein